jgi:starch phosphorylase
MAAAAPSPRERRPSTSAPIADLQGPVGPNFTRPKHKRTVTGFGPSEIKSVEASIPEPQREAWRKFVSCADLPADCGVALLLTWGC